MIINKSYALTVNATERKVILYEAKLLANNDIQPDDFIELVESLMSSAFNKGLAQDNTPIGE